MKQLPRRHSMKKDPGTTLGKQVGFSSTGEDKPITFLASRPKLAVLLKGIKII